MCNCNGNERCYSCKMRKEREKANQTSYNETLCEIIVNCCEQGISSPLYQEAKNALELAKLQREQQIREFRHRSNSSI